MASPAEALRGSAPLSLDRLFAPRGIAFAGVSDRSEGYGPRVVRYCLEGGYQGDIGFVHPRHDEAFGRPCHPRLEDLPGAVDVVVAMVGPARMSALYADARVRG